MTLFTIFWWLLICSALISFSLTLYALSRRSVTGAGPFALVMAGWFIWAFGYLLELWAPTLVGRIFWDNVQFFGIDLAVAGGLLFALAYTGRITRLQPIALQLALFPLLNLFIVWSDPQHNLLRSEPRLYSVGEAIGLIYAYGPWFWIFVVYTYVLISGMLIILIRFAIRNRLHRAIVLTFVVGFSAPTIGGLITVAGLVPIVGAERLDISPLTFAISGPLIAWGLFRKAGLFDLVPIARSLLIDQMFDGTLVVDQFGRIIDANPQAHTLLHYPSNTLPGRTLADLPPALAALVTTTERQQGEIHLEPTGVTILDVTVTPLQLTSAGQAGWLIVLRDSTERIGWVNALRTQAQYNRALATCSQMLLREIRPGAQRNEVLTQALGAIRATINIPRIDLCENGLSAAGEVITFSIAEDALPAMLPCPFNATTPCRLPTQISTIIAQGQPCSGDVATLFADDPAGSAALHAVGIAAILCLPVYIEGTWWGMIFVGDDQPTRTWDAATIDFLRTAADMIASFMQQWATLDTLREREHFIERINQTSPDMIYVYNLVQHNIVYLNQASMTSLGYTPAQLSDTGAGVVATLVHPDDHFRFTEHRQQLFAAAEREIVTIEYRVQDAQGNIRWLFGRDTIFSRDDQGKPVLILGIAQDITARKAVELALQSSEAHQRALLMSLPDLIFLISHEGVFRDYHAPRSDELLVSPKHFLGARIEQVLPPEVALRTRQAMEALQRTGTMQIFDYSIEREGECYVYEARLASVENEGILVMARDVTEMRRSTDTLRQAKERAEAADRAKSMFVAQMSHEIRTPLNAVIGMVELLLETPLSAEQREYAAMINTGGQSLLAIINDILDLARIEAGRIDLDIQPFGLAECLEESLDLVRHTALEKGLRLHSSVADNLPKQVLGDAPRLRQIIVNLLANAIKFTEYGAVTLSATCSDHTTDQATVTISVSDTGIGIAPAQIDAIFAPFVQADGSISRRYGGTGLGLTISRQLTALMHGTLQGTSTPGHGSTFTLTLPLRTLDLSAAPTAAALMELSVLAPGNGAQPEAAGPNHFLVVEDNPINQEVLRHMLLRLGYSCDIVASGAAALEALQIRSYPIVLMDVQMPELDGLATTQIIRTLGDQIIQPVIIAVTASALTGDRERYLATGMDAYLSKPINLTALQDVVQHVMRHKS